ncbi:MAG: ATP-binding protein [Myxococcaceae bacterium]
MNDESNDALKTENARLRGLLREMQERLAEPLEIIRAIRDGEIDALVVEERATPKVYALRHADLLYRAMVEEMKEAAVALDPGGVVLYCNAYFSQLFRVERSQVVGHPLTPFVPPGSESFFASLDGLGPGSNRRGEIVLRSADGESLPVFASLTGLTTEETEVRCLILTDLRKQKVHEALVAESERKDLFLATLAHELRNPIAPIKNAAQILRHKAANDSGILATTAVIDRQIGQLTRLVDDLLDVSRVSRGKIRLQVEQVDVAAVLAGAIEATAPAIQAKGHVLQTVHPPRQVFVKGDAVRLTQVLSNVLHNAAKFTPDHGRITLAAGVDGGTVWISVKDSGIGIAPAMLTRVFDLFEQADTGLARSQGGLGIGLTLAREFLALQSGTIEAKSEGEGKGTEMIIRLPLWEAAEAPARSAPRAATPLKRRRVMVIDDNEDSAQTLAEMMDLWGHEVVTFARASDALEKAPSFKPEVMFVDIGLPDLDGYETARRLRQMPEAKSAMLVAVTGYGQEEDRRRTAAAGFDFHQVKPVDFVALEGLFARLK